VLIQKNLDEHGWHFAITKSSQKGRQISANPNVALTFYWQPIGRQVRIRGFAVDDRPAASQADFLARPVGSRAAALHRQSDVLLSDLEFDHGLELQRQRIDADPSIISSDWTVFAVKPVEVEFWRGSEQRHHVRLRYRRRANEDGWSQERHWP
ncbi:pyridoxamine 5'-phosphate oxidase, partial [Lipomyces doorenjongii]|uniref:pyridoxamine 5'-phosphate oxidase n=1 Tax=Lipomyces doorenjongii TaxID=383834 RepID=UPI0034CD21BF